RPADIARASREAFFLYQFDANAFARRHDGDCEGRFGKAVDGQEGRWLETGIGKCVDEPLHDVGPDHVRPVSGYPPAGKVETVLDMALAGDTPGADIVAESGGVGESGALVAADEVQPGERAPGKILGPQVVGRYLVGDGRKQASDQTHIVIPG